MGVTTTKFVKKPLYVDAVRVTRTNFAKVAKWCSGLIQTERADAPENGGKKYIKIQAHNPINKRQTKAFVGDWVLKTDRGFKIYTHQAFTESFDETPAIEADPPVVYPHMEGGFIIIGPECFSSHDGTVISWKGQNYVPQTADRSVEAEVREFEEENDLDSCVARIGSEVPQ